MTQLQIPGFADDRLKEIKNIIEGLLFVSGDPLSVDKIKNIIEEAQTADIRSALLSLIEEYENRRGGFYLCEVAGGYQFRTRPEYKDWILKYKRKKPRKFSRAVLETLAIIAWNQPIIRSDIEQKRNGVDCGSILRMLLEKKLIRVLGRKEIPGRPLIYGTTRHFLEVFGLRDLSELPTPQEIEDFGEPIEEGDEPRDTLPKPEDIRFSEINEKNGTPEDGDDEEPSADDGDIDPDDEKKT